MLIFGQLNFAGLGKGKDRAPTVAVTNSFPVFSAIFYAYLLLG